MAKQYEVIIVGGGPAGLATGIYLAQINLHVLICEAKPFPVDKACGEGIMPTGVHELNALGITRLISGTDYFPFIGVRYIDDTGTTATGEFKAGVGWGMRRSVLSDNLFQLASNFPQITIREKTRIHSFRSSRQSVIVCSDQEEFEACVLVGADGLHSLVRTQSGFGKKQQGQTRWGINAHFQTAPWSDYVEVYWSNGIEAYVTPLSSREIGLAILWDRARFQSQGNRNQLFAELTNLFPRLRERLRNIPPTGLIQSAGPFLQKPTHVAKNRTVLIGDAAGYLDAITGEGISLALTEAKLCQNYIAALVSNPNQNKPVQAKLERGLRQKIRRSQRMTHFALFLSRHPFLAQQMISLLAKQPKFFQQLLTNTMGNTAHF